MTSRYLLKLRALTAAAIAFAAIPMAAPLYAQEEPAAPAVEAVVEAEAGPVDDYLELVESYGAEYAPAFDFFAISMLWTCIGAAMVFLMHLGFATLESGLTQKKNTVNVLFKNVFVICIGIVTYAAWGFNAHYPGGHDDWGGFFGFGSPIGDLNADGGDGWGYGGLGLAMTGFGDFIFQAMFAATGVTIVGGAVAERIKLPSFMVYGTILVAIAYPWAGSWHWGEGFLNRLDVAFYDFAGSTVVHGFGGAAALAAVIILGPRIGKYTPNGIKPIPGHSLPLATIGGLLLWFGWFGFNGASVLSADPRLLGLVFTTTALGAASGGLSSIITSYAVLKKPDLSMAINGFLAGLVSITGGADAIGPWAAVVMGAVGGVIVVFSVIVLDKVKVDDPVGAISVHGVVGIWGTIAVGLPFFNGSNPEISLVSQFIGIISVYSFAFIFSFVLFFIIKLVMGVRVSPEEEAGGLDIGEHGQEAYSLSNDS